MKCRSNTSIAETLSDLVTTVGFRSLSPVPECVTFEEVLTADSSEFDELWRCLPPREVRTGSVGLPDVEYLEHGPAIALGGDPHETFIHGSDTNIRVLEGGTDPGEHQRMEKEVRIESQFQYSSSRLPFKKKSSCLVLLKQNACMIRRCVVHMLVNDDVHKGYRTYCRNCLTAHICL